MCSTHLHCTCAHFFHLVIGQKVGSCSFKAHVRMCVSKGMLLHVLICSFQRHISLCTYQLRGDVFLFRRFWWAPHIEPWRFWVVERHFCQAYFEKKVTLATEPIAIFASQIPSVQSMDFYPLMPFLNFFFWRVFQSRLNTSATLVS